MGADVGEVDEGHWMILLLLVLLFGDLGRGLVHAGIELADQDTGALYYYKPRRLIGIALHHIDCPMGSSLNLEN